MRARRSVSPGRRSSWAAPSCSTTKRAASQLSEAMLVLAVVYSRAGDPGQARAIVASTGWDIDPPRPANTRDRSLVARSLGVVRPLCTPRYEAAAREGRRAGVVGTAIA